MDKKITIITSCSEAWGGSEELWAKSLPFIRDKGIEVSVIKPNLPFDHPEFRKLKALDVKLVNLESPSTFARRVVDKLTGMLGIQRKNKSPLPGFVRAPILKALKHKLSGIKPSLIIISQGINFDGLGYAFVCMELGYPYVLIAQKAVDFYWPLPDDRRLMKEILKNAKQCYFVSKHNKRLTEEQFAVRLSNAEVIFNPIKIKQAIAFPSFEGGVRLCCIARLFLLDKGQDILLRILSKDKWKERPIHISFIGKGVDEEGLKELAALLEVTNVSFSGHVQEIDQVWANYHALVLPSRSEGLPLTIMEAMMAARVVITTNAGGNTELLEEGVTGFYGNADEVSFELALERAWQNRERWESMGANGHHYLIDHAPQQPERIFANKILELL